MKKKIIIGSITLLLLVGVGLIALSYSKTTQECLLALLWEDSTLYAPKYTDTAFGNISVGMSKSEVLDLLGTPLWVSGDNDRYWNYTKPRKSHYRERIIVFDDNNIVCDKQRGFYVD
ncbi:MAG: outer membrane protein assembly factor BamE [bacterium]|nr:outer membrane protein assembly factor BamE [bacterium]